jgi:hypothetical protein
LVLLVLLCSVGAFLWPDSQVAAGPILQDNFNRPNAPSLGAPWTEANEITAETASLGPGFIELDSQTMTFHYINHSGASTGQNGRPMAFAPLAQTISSFPATLSFSMSPHEDERLHHEVYLMSAADGFFDETTPFGQTFSRPRNALGMIVLRTSSAFTNSQVLIVKAEDAVGTTLAQMSLPFQFDYGGVYDFNFQVADNFSVMLEVSDGISTATLSSGPTSLGFPLNQLVITDTQGGVVTDATPSKDFFLRFDDIMVSVPEPSTLLLLASGLAALIGSWRQRRFGKGVRNLWERSRCMLGRPDSGAWLVLAFQAGERGRAALGLVGAALGFPAAATPSKYSIRPFGRAR